MYVYTFIYFVRCLLHSTSSTRTNTTGTCSYPKDFHNTRVPWYHRWYHNALKVVVKLYV